MQLGWFYDENYMERYRWFNRFNDVLCNGIYVLGGVRMKQAFKVAVATMAMCGKCMRPWSTNHRCAVVKVRYGWFK